MTPPVCPVCERPVLDADALFCAGCGAPLGPPRTVELPDAPLGPSDPPPPPPPTLPPPPPPPAVVPPVSDYVPPLVAVAKSLLPSPPPSVVTDHNRKAAYLGLVGAALAFIGAFQVWLRIRVAGYTPPGSAETGWNGGDGRTVVMAAVAAGLTAAALWVGRRELWLKVTLLITGGVTIVIAIVHMVDVGSKARDIEVQFGIPADDVRAQIGVGLYLVIVGGAAMLIAGLQARTAS